MNDSLRPALAELVGTFAFFFIGAGAIVTDSYTHGGVGLIGIALAHGIILAVMVSAFGAISGGHFNPAVTTAVWLAGKIEPMKAVSYIVVQLVAAVVAGLAVRFVFPEAAWTPSHIGVPALGPGITPGIGI